MAKFPGDLENQFKRITIDPLQILKWIPAIVILILAAILFFTSWVTIQPEEKGVVLRFGKYDRTINPGLHFVIPFGVEKVYAVPVARQLKQEFGFRTQAAGIRTEYSSTALDEESLMLTGDLNVADVEWVTQYRIEKPYNFLFKVRNLEQTFRDMNEAVMREIVGDRSISEILTIGRREIEDETKSQLQERCDQYEMGLSIDQVILQDVNPPESVKPAFNEVNQAQQEKERMINQAQQQYNQVIPKARGDAQKQIQEAEGYALERINRAKGEANRFSAMFQQYQLAPEVTRKRIYIETMEKVLGKVGRKIIVDDAGTGMLPLLNFNPQEE